MSRSFIACHDGRADFDNRLLIHKTVTMNQEKVKKSVQNIAKNVKYRGTIHITLHDLNDSTTITNSSAAIGEDEMLLTSIWTTSWPARLSTAIKNREMGWVDGSQSRAIALEGEKVGLPRSRGWANPFYGIDCIFCCECCLECGGGMNCMCC